MKDGSELPLPPTTLAVVLFSAGGWRIGIEAHRVRSSGPAQGAPTAKAVEPLLGIQAAPQSGLPRQSLRIKQADGDLEIQVDGPVELVEFPVEAIHPPPTLLAQRSKLPGLRALVIPQQGEAAASPILLFDASVL